MAVRTKRLALHATTSEATLDVVYTCPDGRTAIIKDVSFQNFDGGAAANCAVLVHPPGGGYYGVFQRSVLAATTESDTGRFIVLEPGDELVTYVTGAHADNTGIAVFGAELDGVA